MITEKDAQNLAGLKIAEVPVYIAVIDLDVTPDADFRNVLDQTLAAGAGERREDSRTRHKLGRGRHHGVARAARVRNRFPEAEIAIAARPYVADIYRDQDICNQLIAYDPNGLHAGFSGRARLAAELRLQKFDVALLLQNAFDAAWLAWRANIPNASVTRAMAAVSFSTKAVPVPRLEEIPAHEKFYYLELVSRIGWTDSVQDESFITLSVPDEKRQSAADSEKSGVRQGVRRIAIGAGAPTAPPNVGPLRVLPTCEPATI